MPTSLTNRNKSVQVTFDVSDVECTKIFDIPWKLQNVKAKFSYYPKGVDEADDEADSTYASGYIAITDLSGKAFVKDNRFITLEMQCGDERIMIHPKPITLYTPSWGRKKLFTVQHIKRYKKISVSINLDEEYSLRHALREHNINKLESLYELVTEHGDIALVRIPRDEDEDKNEDGDCVQMSRLMLINSSPIFANILKSEECIKIPCKSVDIIDEMVHFIITGYLRVDANVFELIKLAQCYQLRFLLRACLEKMVNNVNENDFVAVFNLFEENDFVTSAHLMGAFNLFEENDDDHDVNKIYPRLLKYFHENKRTLLKNVKNLDELPFCFTQWSDYLDNVANYKQN